MCAPLAIAGRTGRLHRARARRRIGAAPAAHPSQATRLPGLSSFPSRDWSPLAAPHGGGRPRGARDPAGRAVPVGRGWQRVPGANGTVGSRRSRMRGVAGRVARRPTRSPAAVRTSARGGTAPALLADPGPLPGRSRWLPLAAADPGLRAARSSDRERSAFTPPESGSGTIEVRSRPGSRRPRGTVRRLPTGRLPTVGAGPVVRGAPRRPVYRNRGLGQGRRGAVDPLERPPGAVLDPAGGRRADNGRGGTRVSSRSRAHRPALSVRPLPVGRHRTVPRRAVRAAPPPRCGRRRLADRNPPVAAPGPPERTGPLRSPAATPIALAVAPIGFGSPAGGPRGPPGGSPGGARRWPRW